VRAWSRSWLRSRSPLSSGKGWPYRGRGTRPTFHDETRLQARSFLASRYNMPHRLGRAAIANARLGNVARELFAHRSRLGLEGLDDGRLSSPGEWKLSNGASRGRSSCMLVSSIASPRQPSRSIASQRSRRPPQHVRDHGPLPVGRARGQLPAAFSDALITLPAG
jgi:hypothetical protein